MNSIKRQKDKTPKDEPPTQVGRCPIILLGKSRGQLLIAPERIKRSGQSGNDAPWWMCLVVKVKSDAVRNNIAQEPGMSGP